MKWGITNKLLPEKQEMPEYKNREEAKISIHINTKNPSAIKKPLDCLLAGGET